MTIIVLRKMESNTTFNRLLMSLGKYQGCPGLVRVERAKVNITY